MKREDISNPAKTSCSSETAYSEASERDYYSDKEYDSEEVEVLSDTDNCIIAKDYYVESETDETYMSRFKNGLLEKEEEEDLIDFAVEQLGNVSVDVAMAQCSSFEDAIKVVRYCCKRLTRTQHEKYLAEYIANRDAAKSNLFVSKKSTYAKQEDVSEVNSTLHQQNVTETTEIIRMSFSSLDLADLTEETRPKTQLCPVNFKAIENELSDQGIKRNDLQILINSLTEFQCGVLPLGREVLESCTHKLTKLFLQEVLHSCRRYRQVDVRDATSVDLEFDAVTVDGKLVTVVGHSDLFVAPNKLCDAVNGKLPTITTELLGGIQSALEIKGVPKSLTSGSASNAGRSQLAGEVQSIMLHKPDNSVMPSMATDLVVGFVSLSVKRDGIIYHLVSNRTHSTSHLVLMLCLMIVDPTKVHWDRIFLSATSQGLQAYRDMKYSKSSGSGSKGNSDKATGLDRDGDGGTASGRGPHANFNSKLPGDTPRGGESESAKKKKACSERVRQYREMILMESRMRSSTSPMCEKVANSKQRNVRFSDWNDENEDKQNSGGDNDRVISVD